MKDQLAKEIRRLERLEKKQRRRNRNRKIAIPVLAILTLGLSLLIPGSRRKSDRWASELEATRNSLRQARAEARG